MPQFMRVLIFYKPFLINNISVFEKYGSCKGLDTLGSFSGVSTMYLWPSISFLAQQAPFENECIAVSSKRSILKG